ncbi:MAG: hypothetical protein BGO37_05330 [Cellulomonas sp. 73-92]|uniref:hypothetical protein n=1 Tax=Cellulomonas sp. 73-92 TaxID=1895740 RepID=UPI00092C5F72|nr:hypothetical protein [Cellulomonas sp. 73-92]OJV82391.1 MAG: hypothetical protein BGO37_05330 [Cellulomonas sp. 73-92]
MSNGSWTWSPKPEPGDDPLAVPGQAPTPPPASHSDGPAGYAGGAGYGGGAGYPDGTGYPGGAGYGATSRFGTPADPGPGAGWSGAPQSRFGTPLGGGAAPYGTPPSGGPSTFGTPAGAGAPFGTPPAAPFGTAPVGAGYPLSASAGPSGSVTWPLEPLPRRRRRGLWIGVGLGVVALAGGLAAGWFFVGAKLIAPASPTAAVNRFLDGVQHKDGLALLGSLSPAEVQPFRQMVADVKHDTAATPDPAASKAILTAFDSLTVKVDNLQTTEERLDDGLSKVSITGGTLTIDGDPQQIADAVVAAIGTSNPVLGSDPAGVRQQVVDALTGKLPYTVDIAHDWAANGAAPYLVTVHEGRGWYVSPLMTLGEYLTASEGVQRGAMPRAQDVAHPADPTAAAVQLAAAIPALVKGDSGPLVSVLPLAERRFVAVYLQPALDAGAASSGAPELTLTGSDFDVADQNGERASVVPTNLAYSIVMNGVAGTFSYDGNCVKTAAADGSGGGVCLSDIPLMGELGLGHPALTVVHEDGGWYVSLVGTFADWTRTLSDNTARLKAEGKLDDPAWLQQQLPSGMSPLAPAGL